MKRKMLALTLAALLCAGNLSGCGKITDFLEDYVGDLLEEPATAPETADLGGEPGVPDETQTTAESETAAEPETTAEPETAAETAHIHTEVLVPAVDPTCTEKGSTEWKYCDVCKEVLIDSEVVPAKEHTYDSDGICTQCGQEKPSEGLTFTLNDDGQSYSVSGIGTCTDTDVRIPDTHQGLPVTSIGDYAFFNCYRLTSITIPVSVTSIGDYAFWCCSSLTSITIPENVTSIGDGAFQNCVELTSITIPAGVTSIGNEAFSGCSSLTSITIPENVTSIGDYAFSSCSSLTSITIPEGVTRIGDSAFDGCKSLTSVHITDIAAWCNIDFGNTYANPLYYAHNLYLNDELVTDLAIPAGVTSIGNYAFNGCSKLTSITIPESVTSIGDSAFYYCFSLTSITIPEGVTRIGYWAFYDCKSLTSITYLGTTSEWQAIEKRSNWNSNTPDYTIHCTDGTIAKDGTVTPNP